LSEATYSLVSSIGVARADASSTGVGGMPCPTGAPAGTRLHALATATTTASAVPLVIHII
jgi:hypothetical protein